MLQQTAQPNQPPSPPPADDQIDLDSAIETLRQKFNVPRVLVDRMVNQESGGNDAAVSPVGARSRFQVMPATVAGVARETGKQLDPSNPLHDAFTGLYLLRQNYDKVKPYAKSERHAWMMAVAGYHGPIKNVLTDAERGGDGVPDQGDGLINTRDHVFNIFNGTKPEDFNFSAGTTDTTAQSIVPEVSKRTRDGSAMPQIDAPASRRIADPEIDPAEVEHVNAQPTVAAAPSVSTSTPRPDIYTEEGRAARAERTQLEQRPDARQPITVQLPLEWSKLNSADVARMAVKQYAAARNIPNEFTDNWIAQQGDRLNLYDAQGRPQLLTAAPTLDTARRTIRVSGQMPQLLELDRAYQASRNVGERAADWATDPTHTAGEKALDVAAPVVHAGAKALDYATRPLRAVDNLVWSNLRGNDSLQPVADAFMGREPNAQEQNPIANAVADSDTLARINPNLPGMAAAATEMLTSPSNALLPLGGEAVDALKGTRAAARVGAAVEGSGEAGRAERFASGGRMLNIEAAEGGKPRIRFAREGEGITGRGYEVSRNTGRIFRDGQPTEHVLTPTGPVSAPLDELPHHPSYRPDADLAPEAPETLQAQVEAMRAGRRAIVNVTPDAWNDPARKVSVPKDMRSFGTPEGGRIIYNPELVARDEVVRRMDEGTLGELLGHIEPKPEQPTHVVVARDAQTGQEVQSSYVSSPEKAAEQTAAFAEQHPGAQIETGGAELEQQVLDERAASESPHGANLQPRVDSLDTTAGQATADESQIVRPKPLAPALNSQSGAIDLDLLTGGVRPFIQQDVVPAVKAAGRAGLESLHSIRATLAPATVSSEATATADIVRAGAADAARQRDIAHQALETAADYFERQPQTAKYDFIRRVEQRAPHLDPTEATLSQTMRGLFDARRNALGQTGFKDFYNNYFPHLFTDPDAARAFAASFNGARIPGITDAVAAGLKPISDNPVELLTAQLGQMDKSLLARRTLSEMEAQGVARKLGQGASVPAGYALLDEQLTGGARYIAPEPAARIIHNYYSPGLSGNPLFQVWRGAANTLNQAQLGFSFFHAGMVTLDSVVSGTAAGIEDILKYGRPARGLVSILKSPAAPIENLFTGSKMLRAWFNPGAQGADIRQMVDALVEGGGRAQMDKFYSNQMSARMVQAFKQGNIPGGLIRAPFAVVEKMAAPVMEYLVPRQKMGVFAQMARRELERLGPNAAQQDIRRAMAQAWDSTENRLGQLTYDNLFWHKSFKDLSMASVRSVGWNLGTIRELGGAAIDTAAYAKDAAVYAGSKVRGGAAGAPEFTHRMAYAVALPVVIGTMGGMTHYMLTGKAPASLVDYFFPQTGNTDENGNPERISFPSYIKDVYSYSKHPVKTIANKAHPLIGLTADALSNHDFYGTEIRNADDPLMQQLLDTVQYVGKSLEPFSVANASKMRERGASLQKTALPFFGITPAPAELDRTPAQQMMMEMSADRLPQGTRTKEQAARSQLVRDLKRKARTGAEVREDIKAGLASGQLTERDIDIIAETRGTTPLQDSFKRLTLEQSMKAYEAMSDGERQQVRGLLAEKADSIDSLPPARQADVMGKLSMLLQK